MFFFTRTKKSDKTLESAKSKIRVLVSKSLPTLARKRIQGISIDSYGTVNGTRWIKECQHFVDEVVRPQLTDEEAYAVAKAGLNEIATLLLEDPVRLECKRMEQFGEYDTTIRTLTRSKSTHSFCDESSSLYWPNVPGTATQAKITRGLIIRPEPLENILAGRKVWEMRNRAINIRGTIALVKKGSKAIYGVASIVDSHGPVSRAEMTAHRSKHLISEERLDHPDYAKYRYAWVLDNVRRLKTPIPYVHKGGVQFVTLDELAENQLMRALQVG